MSTTCILKFMLNARQAIEVFHLIFLQFMHKALDRRMYAVKGGCNLRFFFRSIRYSEDLDLDVTTIAKDTLQRKVSKLLGSQTFIQALLSHDIVIKHCVESKQTHTTQRWKLGLQIANSVVVIPTKIEFSRRNEQIQYDLCELVNPTLIQAYKLYPILSNHYNKSAAFYQKIIALINRNETQARDVFDLILLMEQSITDIKPIKYSDLAIAINNVLEINFSRFNSTVVAYLLPEYQEYYNNTQVWEAMQLKLIAQLETIDHATS